MEPRYGTIQDLRDEGLLASEVSDARALELLEYASRLIDSLTAQRFGPLEETVCVDGDGSNVVIHPAFLPILEVSKVSVSGTSVSEFRISATRRFIQLPGPVPCGSCNIEITGVFGWLGEQKLVETKTTGSISVDDDAATLLDSTGIYEGDILLIDGTLPVVVVSVSGNDIAFDPVNGAAPSGSRAVCFGRVPALIRRACLMIAIRNRYGLATESASSASVADRIIEERTDGYRYKLASPAAGVNSDGTGIPEVDRILAGYTAPPYAGFV